MTTVPHLADALREVLTTQADALARASGFVQRASKVSGATFAQALVFGWLADPQASLEALAQVAAAVGVTVSAQGLDQRCSELGAVFLEALLARAVQTIIAAEPVAIPLLRRFSAVVLLDSSTVALPAAMAPWWPGCGNASTSQAAALKLHVRYDLCAGTLQGPLLTDGRTHDSSAPLQNAPLPAGALRIADLGFFDVGVCAQIAAGGAYWLTRLRHTTAVYDQAGQRCDLVAQLAATEASAAERVVTLGAQHRLPARLLAVRVPSAVATARRRRCRQEAKRRGRTPSAVRLAWCDWTILVTNVPAGLLTLEEALVLLRARWQIELLFKLWKSHGHIDESRSTKPWRILCEVFAKLLAMVVQHWLLLVGCWAYPDRSLVKAAHTVRQHALAVVCALAAPAALDAVLTTLQRCLAAGCRLNRRTTKPNTYQLLLDPALGGLA